MDNKMDKIVSLAKRRGFVYQSSEIYGGLRNVYDYGPMGVELIKNIKDLWWSKFVHKRQDIVGLESAILMHPQVWVASGHVGGFSDPMVEDKETHDRYRADHIIQDWIEQFGKDPVDTDLMDINELNSFISENNILSPSGNQLTPAKQFNLMFETELGATEEDTQTLYLRAETAQGMFVDYKNVLQSSRRKVPFGIAQQGRVFRNEITTGKFLFRMLEFQQMEIEYYFDGSSWEEQFEHWRGTIEDWYFNELMIPENKFNWAPHSKLIFYAKAAEDIQYQFSWGFDEVSGLHYRTDYDLATHQKHSGEDMTYRDTEAGKEFTPHVLETTWGLDRNFFMIMDNAFTEEEKRQYLKLPPKLAPYKAAVFPLLANKDDLVKKARSIYDMLLTKYHIDWDDRGNIGKRYFAQDEIGTPWCITVDFESLQDDAVTIRDRDTAEQERVSIERLVEWIEEKVNQ